MTDLISFTLQYAGIKLSNNRNFQEGYNPCVEKNINLFGKSKLFVNFNAFYF